MSWPKEAVNSLIEEWQKYPCLYNAKSTNYYNKHARTAALDCILEATKIFRPNSCTADIKNKMSSLRTQFVSEINKVRQSSKSGCGTDEVFVPSWCFYKKLLFLSEHVQSRKSTSVGIPAPTICPAATEARDDQPAVHYFENGEGQLEFYIEGNDDTTNEATPTDILGSTEKQHPSAALPSSCTDTPVDVQAEVASSLSSRLSDVEIARRSPVETPLKKRRTLSRDSTGSTVDIRAQESSAKTAVLQAIASRMETLQRKPAEETCPMVLFLADSWRKIKNPKLQMELKHKWMKALMEVEEKDAASDSSN